MRLSKSVKDEVEEPNGCLKENYTMSKQELFQFNPHMNQYNIYYVASLVMATRPPSLPAADKSVVEELSRSLR